MPLSESLKSESNLDLLASYCFCASSAKALALEEPISLIILIFSSTDVALDSLVINSELLDSATYSPRVLPFTETFESLEPKTLIDFERSDLL